VPVRGPLPRVLLCSGLLGGGALGVVGGLSLRGPGLIAVGMAATLAACTAAGIARESDRHDRRSTVEATVQAAAWTVGGLLVISGIAALAGGGVAALVVGAALAAWLVRAALRARRPAPSGRPEARSTTGTGTVRRLLPPENGAPRTIGGAAGPLPPVWALTTPEIGEEWLVSTVALAGRLDATTRQSLVSRRQEALDELERRDADGFARWLAVGPGRDSDPAAYVRGGPIRPARDTDAA
jgi:hypothetical protein